MLTKLATLLASAAGAFIRNGAPKTPDARRFRARCLQCEPLENRHLMAGADIDFLIAAAQQYSISTSSTDLGQPILPLYADYLAGGAYGAIDFASAVELDANDPDAGQGVSSFQMKALAPGGVFQFGIGLGVLNRPREGVDFGLARAVRFQAKGDLPNQQLQVVVLKRDGAGGSVAEVSQTFSLTTTWADYQVLLPTTGASALRPQDLHAVRFVLSAAGTVRLDEVRIATDRYDPLQWAQSYQPSVWAAADSPPESAEWRNVNLHSNRAYLDDQALAIKALNAAGDAASRNLARDIVEAVLATSVNSAAGYFDERNSGHVLQGDGSRRPANSQQKSVVDNSWFGLALLDEFNVTGEAKYLNHARQISDWVEANFKDSGPLAGYRGGFDKLGAPVAWRSTEDALVLFELNYQIKHALRGLNDPSANTYASRADHAAQFVIAMFDPVAGKFFAGTSTGDSINQDSIPLAAQLLPLLSLGQRVEYAAALDWSRALRWAEANLQRSDGGQTGFTFSSQSAGGKIGFEGESFAAAAYRLLGETQRAQEIIARVDAAGTNDGAILAVSSDSLSDTFLDASFDARPGIAPTALALLAKSGTNPLGARPLSWRNSISQFDVNDDTAVTPLDALLIIIDLNARGSRDLSPPLTQAAPPLYVDVNDDGAETPLDALLVIISLNTQSNLQPEAEGDPAPLEVEPLESAPALLSETMTLAANWAEYYSYWYFESHARD